MTNIRNPSAPVNGGNDVERKKKDIRRKFDLLTKVACIPQLTGAAKSVAVLLIQWFDDDLGYAYAKHVTLADWTGQSLSSVKRATAQLDELGVIPIKLQGKRGRANRYVPNWAYRARADTETPEEMGVANDTQTGDWVSPVNGVGVTNDTQKVSPMTPSNPPPTRSDNGGLEEGPAARGLAPGGAPRARGADAGAPEHAASFERFWNAYPKKVGRALARGAFDAVIASGDASVEVLVAKAEQYANATAHLPDQRYIKQPANWLNQECWLEDPKPPRPKEPKPERAPRASKANGKAAPESPFQTRARAAGFVVGALVRDHGTPGYVSCEGVGRVLAVDSEVVTIRRLTETIVYDEEFWFQLEATEVIGHADPNEPESPDQVRARQAGFVVGALVRDVGNYEHEFFRQKGLGEVVGVYPNGYVEVLWFADGFSRDYREKVWNELQVVGTSDPKHRSLTLEARAAIAKLEERGFKIGACVRDNISNLPIRGTVVGLGSDGLVEVNWGRKTEKLKPHEVRVVDPRTGESIQSRP
jgi:hypothetical protein